MLKNGRRCQRNPLKGWPFLCRDARRCLIKVHKKQTDINWGGRFGWPPWIRRFRCLQSLQSLKCKPFQLKRESLLDPSNGVIVTRTTRRLFEKTTGSTMKNTKNSMFSFDNHKSSPNSPREFPSDFRITAAVWTLPGQWTLSTFWSPSV